MTRQANNAPLGFEKLVREHSGRIRRIARRFAESGAVDDLVQDILTRLWRSYPSFRGDAKIESWIYRVSLNAAMTHVGEAIKVPHVARSYIRARNSGGPRNRQQARVPHRSSATS